MSGPADDLVHKFHNQIYNTGLIERIFPVNGALDADIVRGDAFFSECRVEIIALLQRHFFIAGSVKNQEWRRIRRDMRKGRCVSPYQLSSFL